MQVQSAKSPSVAEALALMARSTSGGQGASAETAAGSNATGGVARYDFSNMTPAQMRDAVNRLIRSGDLSLDETGSLLGIMAPPSARWKVDGTQMSAAEGERIDNTPVDAFAKLREGIAGAQWLHDSAAEAALSKTLAALQHVQGMVSSVDIRA